MASAHELPGVEFAPMEITALWAVQGDREQSLAQVEQAAFAGSAGIGELLVDGEDCWLRAWPDQAWLLSRDRALPERLQDFAALATDISDACCAFRCDGEQAFAFLADYLSADLAAIAADSGCLRCRLGHYVVLLWWRNRQRLQLLVERSLADSFADYIGELMARRRLEAS